MMPPRQRKAPESSFFSNSTFRNIRSGVIATLACASVAYAAQDCLRDTKQPDNRGIPSDSAEPPNARLKIPARCVPAASAKTVKEYLGEVSYERLSTFAGLQYPDRGSTDLDRTLIQEISDPASKMKGQHFGKGSLVKPGTFCMGTDVPSDSDLVFVFPEKASSEMSRELVIAHEVLGHVYDDHQTDKFIFANGFANEFIPAYLIDAMKMNFRSELYSFAVECSYAEHARFISSFKPEGKQVDEEITKAFQDDEALKILCDAHSDAQSTGDWKSYKRRVLQAYATVKPFPPFFDAVCNEACRRRELVEGLIDSKPPLMRKESRHLDTPESQLLFKRYRPSSGNR